MFGDSINVPASTTTPRGSIATGATDSNVAPQRTGRSKARAVGVVGGLASVALLAGLGAATAAQAAPRTTLHMGTASTPTVDAAGATWAAGTGFADGRLITPPAAGTVIKGTNDQALYLSSMFTMTNWSAPVINGRYDVTLRMVDTWYGNAGQRVFNVTAENKAALTNVDIAGAVGQYAAYDRTFTVRVTDGTLNLGFVKNIGEATVSAIAVVPHAAAVTPPPVITPPAPAYPDATDTGPAAGTTFTRWDGNNKVITLTTPGATYSNLDIHARIRILAPNITLKNSIVRGDSSYTLGSIIDVNYPGYDHSNFTLMDSEVVPEFPQWQQDGILGFGYNVIRSNIHGTTDAVKVVGDNVTVTDSFLHDTTYFVVPGVGYGDTHNDGIQAVKGNHVTITHNTITGNKNSAVMLGQDQGGITDWKFINNYMDDGGCSINTASKAYATIGPFTFTNNVFGTHQTNPGCAIVLNATKTTYTATGNTWTNGTPVVISRGM